MTATLTPLTLGRMQPEAPRLRRTCMKRLLSPAAVLLVAATACSSGGGGGSGSSGSTAAVKGAPAGVAAPAPAAGTLRQDSPIVVGRSQILTAGVQVDVKDVRRATAAAEQLVADAGGDVAQEQVDLQARAPRATLRLDVPPNRLDALLDSLGALGRERSRSRGTQDVTDQVVDVSSRLATQQASVNRVRKLLDRATSLTDIVRLEAELAQREADLESLQARLRSLSNRVAMAQVTVDLATAARPGPARDAQVGFLSGLRSGWRALQAVGRVAGATAGALLPFLPLLLALGGLGWWLRRRSALT